MQSHPKHSIRVTGQFKMSECWQWLCFNSYQPPLTFQRKTTLINGGIRPWLHCI